MVEALAQSGILKSARLRQAFLAAPRHLFITSYYPRSTGADAEPLRADDPALSKALLDAAYDPDEAIALRKAADGWTWTSSCSSPAIVCEMLERLNVGEGMSVLEIGTGSGWNSALLSALVGPSGAVHSVEVQPDVASEAREHLEAAGFSGVDVRAADGASGLPDGAPYDRIVVTAGTPDVHHAWLEQLKPDGRLLLPLELPGLLSPLLEVEHGGRARFAGHSEFMHMLGGEAVYSSLEPAREPELAALLATPPRVHSPPWSAEDAMNTRLSFLFYLHLVDSERAASVYLGGSVWESWAGLWDRQRSGLALLGDERAVSYGDERIWDELMERNTRWTELGRPGLEDYTVVLAAAGAQAPEACTGVIRRKRTSFQCFLPRWP